MCFCKSGLVVLSNQDSLNSCANITCNGDQSTYCGNTDRYLVYGIGNTYTILNISMPQNIVPVNTFAFI